MISTARAIGAITEAALERGLPQSRPRILRDRTNVLVHLEPAPVVARVPITLARLRPRSWFETEIRLTRWLADAGAPVAPPSADVDPGPSEHDGLLVTFWDYVDHDPDRFEPELVGRSLRELHEALAGFQETLPAFDRLDEIRLLLEALRPSPVASDDELARLRAALKRLDAPQPTNWRPLHGDSHLNNVLWSPDGPLWTDFENVCLGPIEYDLACMLWRDAAGTERAVAAYGPYDSALADRVEPFLALFLAAWTIAVVERAPSDEALGEARRRIERATAGVRPG